MKQQRKSLGRQLRWKKIPAARRHFYVYALILLGAVVGNSVKEAIVGPIENEPAPQAGTSRMEGMRQSSVALY